MLKQALLNSLAVNADENLVDIWSKLEQKQNPSSTVSNKVSSEGPAETPSCNEEILGPADFEKFCNAMKMSELSFLQHFPVSLIPL
jgi:hypothetical protein